MKQMFFPTLRCCFIVLLCSVSHEQFSQAFTDVAASQGINMIEPVAPVLGIGLSFYDFDHDGWDDITFATKSDSLILYRNMEGNGFQRIELFTAGPEGKQPVWVDYDNDGDADMLYTRRSSGTQLFRNDGNMIFTNVTANLGLPATAGVHIYGQSWADYDRDGWLDVYLSTLNTSNNIRNYLLHNNGNGTFTNVAIAAGVDNGLRPTFQSVWQDFNMDNWPDLFVINDSGFGNNLYLNDGDGTFTEITVSANIMGDAMDSMSSSVCDFDNDGDWDIYVTDLPDGNGLFVNDGNLVFTDEAVALNVTVNSWCWGSTWIDYDNDTDNDLHVTTATAFSNTDVLYTNLGDGTFTNAMYSEFASEVSFTYAGAKGDFDQDGYTDMAVFASNDSASMLLHNNGGSNHWLKLTLQGTYSNRDAIGSLVEYYIDGNRYMYYTRCGEDFLTQHSQHFILGLGEAMQIDSLVVTWPRGLIEKWYDVSADQWLHLIEGENTSVNIVAENNAHLCPNDVLTLYAGEWQSVEWNTEETTSNIQVNAAGVYSVSVTDANGYTFQGSVEVIAENNPDIQVEFQHPGCWYSQDGYAGISSTNGVEIMWDDANTAWLRTNLSAGTYFFTVTSEWNCTTEGEVTLLAPDAIVYNIAADGVSCFGLGDGMVEIEPGGGTGMLTVDYLGDDPNMLFAGEHTAIIEDENNCTLMVHYEIDTPDPITVQLTTMNASCYGWNDGSATAEATGGTGSLTIDWMGEDNSALSAGSYQVIAADENGCTQSVSFEIGEPDELVLEVSTTNVLCYGESNGTCELQPSGGTGPYEINFFGNNPGALSAGPYSIEITDAHGCTASANFTISQPDALSAEVFHLAQTATQLGWAAVAPQGGTPPYQYLWNNNDTDSLIQEVEEGIYTCLVQDANGCDLVVTVSVPFNDIVDLYQNEVSIYPNPAKGFIILKNIPDGCMLMLNDAAGRKVAQSFDVHTMDVSHLSSGVYTLHIHGERYNASGRVIIER